MTTYVVISLGLLGIHEEELASGLLVSILDGIQLIDTRAEIGGISTESDL